MNTCNQYIINKVCWIMLNPINSKKKNSSYVWVFTGCTRNTSHILNCQLYGASDLRQVAMVVPSSYCFNIFFSRYDQLSSWFGPVDTPCVCCWNIFQDWWICNSYREPFVLISCYIGMMLFQVENFRTTGSLIKSKTLV